MQPAKNTTRKPKTAAFAAEVIEDLRQGAKPAAQVTMARAVLAYGNYDAAGLTLWAEFLIEAKARAHPAA